MKRIIVGISILLLCASTAALGEEKSTQHKIIPVIGGILGDGTSAGKSFSSSCSLSYDGPYLNGTSVLVTGVSECTDQYSPETFYDVAYRGKKYFVKSSGLAVKPEDLERLKSMFEGLHATYEKASLEYTRHSWLETVKKSFDALEKAGKQGIVVIESSVYDISEYTEGTGFKISVYNSGKKRIKYVTATYVGYNAVKDPVSDYRSRSHKLTLQGIGPIEPGITATYSKDYAWMTDQVETVKLTGLKVQYMDGTSKTIKNVKAASLSYGDKWVLDENNNEMSKEDQDSDLPPAAAAAPAAK